MFDLQKRGRIGSFGDGANRVSCSTMGPFNGKKLLEDPINLNVFDRKVVKSIVK